MQINKSENHSIHRKFYRDEVKVGDEVYVQDPLGDWMTDNPGKITGIYEDGFIVEFFDDTTDVVPRDKMMKKDKYNDLFTKRSIQSAEDTDEGVDLSSDFKQRIEKIVVQFFKENPNLELISDDDLKLDIPTKKYKKYEYAVRVTRDLDKIGESIEYYIEIWTMLFDDDARELCYYLDDYLENMMGYEGSVEVDQLELITGFLGKIPVYESQNIEASEDDEDTIEQIEFTDEIDLEPYDVLVDVYSNGTWGYVDETYEFCKPNQGNYWPLEDNDDPNRFDNYIEFKTAIDVVEDFDTVIEDIVPSNPGRYSMNGTAKLYYDIDADAYTIEEHGREEYVIDENTYKAYLDEDNSKEDLRISFSKVI